MPKQEGLFTYKTPDKGFGAVLDDLEVTVGDPTYQPPVGSILELGRHKLAVVDPATQWNLFVPLLKPGYRLILWPNPAIMLRDLDAVPPLVMVQPDRWLAGHLLDWWERVWAE